VARFFPASRGVKSHVGVTRVWVTVMDQLFKPGVTDSEETKNVALSGSRSSDICHKPSLAVKHGTTVIP